MLQMSAVISVPARRLCIHCREYFESTSAGNRVCSKCTRPHIKLIERYGAAITIESTPQMKQHLRQLSFNEKNPQALSDKDINKFLDGGDVDDSSVYKQIKKKKVINTIRDLILEGLKYAKERKVQPDW